MKLTILLLLAATLAVQFALTSPTEDSLQRMRRRATAILRGHGRLKRNIQMPSVCPDPGTPAFSSRIPEDGTFEEGDEVVFECQPGYVLQGSSVLNCKLDIHGKASWDAETPHCLGEGRSTL